MISVIARNRFRYFHFKNYQRSVFFSSVPQEPQSLPKEEKIHETSTTFLERSFQILTKSRSISLYVPRFIQSKLKIKKNPTSSKLVIPFTWSNIAGHGSFLFLALSYLESDFLSLRLYAFSGISLSIIFQYYREKPLWIPIRWNSLFLLINAIMIMILLKEEDDARNIPDEQKLLYHQVFEKRGMKPVDYLHLISVAKRLEVKRGEAIIHCGKKNKYLYLVKQGSLSVRKPETKMQPIAMIERHQFIGEMSFLNWSNTLTMMTSLQQQEAEELKSSLTSNTNNDSKEVVDSSVDEEAEDRLRSLGKFISLVQGYVGLDSSDDGKRNLPTQKTDKSTKKRGVNSLEDGFLVQADVVAEEDCVIFAWKFKDLYQLMNQYPSLGFVFERCLSNDLHQKMAFRALPSSSTSSSPPSTTSSTPTTSSDSPSTENTTSVGNDQNQGSIWEEDMRMRYKQILFGGLMDGEINKIEKQILHQFRQRYSISMLEHNQLLMDLNWTPEDYERGYQLR